MIRGPALGASPCVLPFFKRAPAGETIAVTPLGTNFGSFPTTLSVGPVSLGASDYLLVGTSFQDTSGGNTNVYSVNIGGFNVPLDLSTNYGPLIHVGHVWSVAMNGTARAGTVTIDFSLAIAVPDSCTIVVSKATGILQVGAPDRTASATGSGTTQDSGLTAALAQAHELVYGIIFTTGRATDTVGTWTAPLVAGQNAGSGIVQEQVKEGYAIVTTGGTYRARVTGATNRPWGALCKTYKAA
ncbi:MAG TPA: hypothetical protein VEW68_05435 [Patescibacteria group bacterium]|nr:hypothetical protein [Patescibacteria group bacterium]